VLFTSHRARAVGCERHVVEHILREVAWHVERRDDVPRAQFGITTDGVVLGDETARVAGDRIVDRPPGGGGRSRVVVGVSAAASVATTAIVVGSDSTGGSLIGWVADGANAGDAVSTVAASSLDPQAPTAKATTDAPVTHLNVREALGVDMD
jgi:hypothetical protein